MTNKQTRGVSYIGRLYIALKVSMKKPKGSSRKLLIAKEIEGK